MTGLKFINKYGIEATLEIVNEFKILRKKPYYRLSNKFENYQNAQLFPAVTNDLYFVLRELLDKNNI